LTCEMVIERSTHTQANTQQYSGVIGPCSQFSAIDAQSTGSKLDNVVGVIEAREVRGGRGKTGEPL
jgi:hypothetical protein